MPGSPIKLLLIDDDVDFADYVESLLVGTKRHSITVDHVADFENACKLVAEGIHDAYLVDHELGIAEKSGFDLISFGRDVAANPMIMLTSNLEEDTGDKAMSLGASDFLHKQHATIPVIERVVRNSIKRSAMLDKLSASDATVTQSHNTDQLTGASSRLAIEHYLDRCLSSCTTSQVGALLYIDLDDFKPINDYYGHVAGDQVLKIFARRVAAVAPPDYLLGRMGGDEFLLAGPAADHDIFLNGNVDLWLTDLRDSIGRPMKVYDVAGDSVEVKIALSIGVVRFGSQDRDKDYLIALASKAMYMDQARNNATPSTG